MSPADHVFTVLLLIVPTVLALLAGWLVFRGISQQHRAAERAEQRLRTLAALIPLRIAAHERAVLFLTRIPPDALLLRHEPARLSAPQLLQALLDDLRTEYDHNAVQQLYVGDDAWASLLHARDVVAGIVAESAQELPASASGVEMAQAILQAVKDRNEGPVPAPLSEAIRQLKADLARA